MQLTPLQLWNFCSNKDETSYEAYKECVTSCFDENDQEAAAPSLVDEATWDKLVRTDLKVIFVDQNMSENDLGGDSMVSAVSETADAIAEGYKVFSWYGPDGEALAVGYWPHQYRVEKVGAAEDEREVILVL